MKLYENYCSIVAADTHGYSRRGIIVGPGQWTWGDRVGIYYIAAVERTDLALFAMDSTHLIEYQYDLLVSARRFFLEDV